jgi:predicted unusual protein kinase regulating ubiquinone biosynthesis (AarF/ABC1/UbiB family)
MLNHILKITKIILSISYHVIIYKLNLKSYNDTIINISNSLVTHSFIFIKIIQWGIQNVYDFNFDEKVIKYFNAFNNQVPYNQLELEQSLLTIQNAVNYALTCRNDTLEIKNNYVPINSGSVALVYKAHLNDKPVIIKVLRYHIRNTINEDICFLEYFFDNIFVKNIINYYIKINFKKNNITNIRDILIKQCDFGYEVNNALLFKNNLKNKKNVIIPNVYKHFTDVFHDIIIMDYLDGPVAINVPSYQLQNNCEIIRSIYFESLFQYNILHGDFHLGNIIIVNENTFGIIDFGIVYEINNEISNKLFDIIFLNLKRDLKSKLQLIKILVDMICENKDQCKEICMKIKNDNELMNLFFVSKFSGSALVAVLSKITIMDGIEIEINNYIHNLLFSFLSGLQTIENCTKNINEENRSTTTLIKSYMNKIKI